MKKNIRQKICLTTLSLFTGLTCLNGAIISISTADGAGADAYTSSGATTTNYGTESFISIDRDSRKSYLKFDLSVIPDLDTITDVTFTLEQIPPSTDKVIEFFGINLDYDFVGEARLSATDWGETEITHANAPASGSGGSVSTSGSRSILFGDLTVSVGPDFQFYTYTESSSDVSTPLLDYLNGISGFSDGTASKLRSFVLAEDPSSNRTTEAYGSLETGGGTMAPTLDLTYTVVPEPSHFALILGLAITVLLWGRSRRNIDSIS